MQIERRKLRLPFQETFPIDLPGKGRFSAHGVDISVLSIKFSCTCPLSEGENVSVVFTPDLILTGKVFRVIERKEKLEAVLQFTDTSDEQRITLSEYIADVMVKEYQKVDLEGFKFLIYCIAIDGIEETEEKLLRRWLEISHFTPELKELLLNKIYSPPSSREMFQKAKEYLLLHKSDLIELKPLWHNLEILICADGVVSLHEKLILQTIFEMIPGIMDHLSEIFDNSSVLLIIQRYLQTKREIIQRLKDAYADFPNPEWTPYDKEFWTMFLSIRLCYLLSDSTSLQSNPGELSILLQPYFLISDVILQELIRQSIAFEDSMSKSDLLQEFLLVADPDQRNMLIDVLRELMSKQSGIGDEVIALFTELVKGRGNISLASETQGFREKNVISIGAADENDLVAPILAQTQYSARIELEDKTFNIITGGQLFFYIRGEKYQSYRGNDAFIEFTLRNVRIFFFSKARIIFFEESPEHYLTLDEYDVFVPDRVGWNPFSSKNKKILRDLRVGFRTGEYVGIFGPTGSGKSTLLLSLLNRYETRGNVWIDGISYRDYYRDHFYEVGFVPQDDVLHRDLTIYETLHYSIALRGIEKDSERIKQLIARTIDQLDLEKAVDVIVGDEQRKGISGGQRKRVNLALELLSENIYLLMLDEPTSGLDPATERQILQLLRNLSSHGLMVLMVSHSLYEVTMAMLDLALILTEQGEIAYYGPAVEAKYYFQVDTPQEIFDLLKQQPSSYWAEKFRQIKNDYYRKYTLTRLKLNQIRLNEDNRSNKGKPVTTDKQAGENQTSIQPKSERGLLEQFGVSTKRLFRRQTRDRQSIFSRALQAVLLALVLRIAYVAVESGLLTLLSIVPVWLGATMSIRSINSELPIFFREYRYRLGIFSYVLSIFFANAIFIFVQVLIFTVVLYLLLPLHLFGFGFFQVLLIVYLTSLVGIGIGMILSAIFSSQQAAVNALPLFLVFMILFGGSVIQLKDMSKMSYWLSNITPTRWALEGLFYEGTYLATNIPQVKSWEHIGKVSDSLQKKLEDDKLFPFEIQSPKWDMFPLTYILKTADIQPPMAGNAMRLMGLYRQPLSDCTLDNFDACPAALVHKYTIKLILLVQILILMGGCIGIMFMKSRSQN